MDQKLLLELFSIPASSGEEKAISIYIQIKLKELGIKYKVDKIGNIFNIDIENKPLLSAHMDTVQDSMDSKLAPFIDIRGSSRILSGYGVIGGDDKCGLYLILSLLKYEKFNFLFTVQEEEGGKGSSDFIEQNNIKNIPYGLVLDRRGSSDIICDFNEYGTKELEDALIEVGRVFSYKSSYGTFSDADYISKQISCANLSVGYYSPHSKDEYVILDDLEVAQEYIHEILRKVDTKFVAPIQTKRFRGIYSGISHYNGGYEINDFSSDFSDVAPCDFCNKDTIGETVLYLSSISAFICSSCFSSLREEMSEKEFKDMRELEYSDDTPYFGNLGG